jgi:hypothetical protein
LPDDDKEDFEIVLEKARERPLSDPFQFIPGPPTDLPQPKDENHDPPDPSSENQGIGLAQLGRGGAGLVSDPQVSNSNFLLLTPEPSTALLLGAGLAALAVVNRRRRSG